MRYLAIDPGNRESAYAFVDEHCRPRFFDKVPNDALFATLHNTAKPDKVAIEMVASYGMPVGADVFETCVWIGRVLQWLEPQIGAQNLYLVKRLQVKMHHCHSARATDATVRQALVDRFAAGQPNHGKGTIRQPGWFYGFRADVWQAYALAVYAADTQLRTETAG